MTRNSKRCVAAVFACWLGLTFATPSTGQGISYGPKIQSPEQVEVRRKTCEASGGKLQEAGLSGYTYGGVCTHPFADAGKRCRDDSECRAKSCLGDPRRGGRYRAIGTCAPNDFRFGCLSWVRKGVLVVGPCQD